MIYAHTNYRASVGVQTSRDAKERLTKAIALLTPLLNDPEVASRADDVLYLMTKLRADLR